MTNLATHKKWDRSPLSQKSYNNRYATRVPRTAMPIAKGIFLIVIRNGFCFVLIEVNVTSNPYVPTVNVATDPVIRTRAILTGFMTSSRGVVIPVKILTVAIG